MTVADIPRHLQGQVAQQLYPHARNAEIVPPEAGKPREHKRRDNPEQREQIAVIAWFNVAHKTLGVTDECLLAHVPNGGRRFAREAQALSRAGVRSGWPDLQLMVSRGGYHALFIEMKAGDNVETASQRRMRGLLEAQGYLSVVATGREAAIRAIENYCGLPS